MLGLSPIQSIVLHVGIRSTDARMAPWPSCIGLHRACIKTMVGLDAVITVGTPVRATRWGISITGVGSS